MWIANLSNGETITEQEMGWDDLPIERITCLHLVNGRGTAFIRARPGYQFFQYKSRSLVWDNITGIPTKTPIHWRRIGAVINADGDCIYIQTDAKGGFDTRFDNVLDMKLNLPHLRISLPEEVIQKKMDDLNGPAT